MESEDALKEIGMKNHTRYYFDNMIKVSDIYSVDFLLDKKSYETHENTLVYNIPYETTGPKPLCIRFDRINWFIRVLDGEIKHSILCDYGLFNKICDRIKYLIRNKRGVTNKTNHNFRKIRIYSYNSLPIEEILTFHNVIIHSKSVVNKNKNEYYYDVFLGKGFV